MRNTLRGAAAVLTAATAMGGSLLLSGVAEGAVMPSGGMRSPEVVAAGPNGCVHVRHILNNGVQATNVSCGRTVQVRVIWSTPPNSMTYAIGEGGSRDYYPHFSWQHYETIEIS
ncbi:hypothetical protein [Actinomadura harenae]|uniref:Uncharacterized protein n=1 Tax=Actinomadura harenae TaxID=2483351 RepID=A0A3M2LVW1_9ACTN|nr:hypothetical protein [Actinomadura harenae]RMI41609.1 hypothetical protein EBO15_22690 [Actinomadura harenae]